jgi:predicted Zn-dependent peptidase
MRPGVEMTELASGLRVASELRPDVHGVALGAWVRVGSRDEAALVAGVSHLLEHLLFRGTERHDAMAIAEAFDRFGSDLQAATSREETDLHARVLSEHVPLALDIIGSMVARPGFHDVDAEREVVLEELALYDDTPDDLVHDVLGELLFPEQAIGRPIAGWAGTVGALDEGALRAHHARHYAGDQVVVAAAGPLAHDRLVTLVEAAFDGLAPGGARERLPAVAASGRRAFVARELEQTHIAIGGRGIGRTDERRFALAVLDQILGGGASSRLWQEIREQRGLAYSVYSYVTYFQETGQVGLALGTRTENLAAALGVAAAEIRDLADGRFRDGEVERARDNLKARLLLTMDSTVARMSRLGRQLVSDVPLLDDAEVARRIDAVAEADVRDLAAELFAPDALCVAGIGPDEAVFDAALGAFREPVGGAA